MPVPLYTQTVVAFVWDFDRTLIPGDMEEPIFAAYDVDPDLFWAEVAGLGDHYARQGVEIQRDLGYLSHLLTYVQKGIFADLTNERLRSLGALLEVAPGMPEFMQATKDRVAEIPEFVDAGIEVEHYVVSTGIRSLVEGSVFAPHLDGIWANTLIETPAEPGYLDQLPVAFDPAPVSRVGYAVDDTSKTRALFEINKGANRDPDLDVNARVAQDQRRVPLRHMIYVADGPSDVPCFSILNANGGKTLGVYTTEPTDNYREVRRLQDQGRIQGIAEADYRPGRAAHGWLMDGLEQIGHEIVEARRQAFPGDPDPTRDV
jgi:hypothetical protein